ncbi:MAG: hypothetical protein N2505_05405 [Endomicrobia bacterium]|nr:hypothetical protein [Endomicrobiia bacterium]
MSTLQIVSFLLSRKKDEGGLKMIYHVFLSFSTSKSFLKYNILNNYLKFGENFSIKSLKNVAETGIRKYILTEQNKKLIYGKLKDTEKESYFIYAFDYVDEIMTAQIDFKLNEDSVFFTVNGEINKKIYIEALKVLSSAMRVQPISLNTLDENDVKSLFMVIEPIEEAIVNFNLVDPRVEKKVGGEI